jgi:hypothetical protein
MRALENRINRLEAQRSYSDNYFLVVLISKFFGSGMPSTRVGGTLMKQAPDETFEIFEARAVAAAKAAGDSWRVAITVPAGDSIVIGN